MGTRSIESDYAVKIAGNLQRAEQASYMRVDWKVELPWM